MPVLIVGKNPLDQDFIVGKRISELQVNILGGCSDGERYYSVY